LVCDHTGYYCCVDLAVADDRKSKDRDKRESKSLRKSSNLETPSAFRVQTSVDHYSNLYVTVFIGKGLVVPNLLSKKCRNSVEAGLKAHQNAGTADWE
jgi:hypothetical protein